MTKHMHWSKRQLTSHQAEFAERFAKGEDMVEIAKDLYWQRCGKKVSKAGLQKIALDTLEKPQVKRAVIRTWEAAGMRLDTVAQKHWYLINKPRGKDADKLRGIDMYYRGIGLYDNEEQKTSPKSVLSVIIQNRIDRGLDVPEEIKKSISVEEIKEEGERKNAVTDTEPKS